MALTSVALLAAACRGYGDVSKSVELTQRDSGSSVDVKVTQVLIITLPANHTTPYHWVLTQAPDPRVLEKVADTYESSPGPPAPAGRRCGGSGRSARAGRRCSSTTGASRARRAGSGSP